MNKKYFIGLIMLMMIGLFACSNKEDDDSITISVWNRHPELNETWANFIDKFEAEHSGIKVQLENIPVSTQAASYQAAVSENNLPDIFDMATYSLDELVHLDLVKDLNELFSEEEKAKYYPGTWFENGTTLNGSVYIFPVFSPNHGAKMFYYNKDVLEANGISEDELPKTWDELIEMGKKIYEETDGKTYGLIFYNADWAVTNFIHAQSTAISPETPTTMNYKEGKPEYISQGKIETIRFLKKLLDEKVMHPISLEIDTFQAEAEFAAGNAAFYLNGNWAGSDITSLGFDNWGVTELPTKDGMRWYSGISGSVDGLAVSKKTEHWEEVKTFLEFGKEYLHSEVVIASGGSQPAKMDVKGDAPFPQFETILELMTKAYIPFPKPVERSLSVVDFERRYNELLTLDNIGDLAVGYLTGEVNDLEAELEKMDKEANEVFDQLLDETEDVVRDYYQFPNWEPFNPYLEEYYEELE